MSPALASPANAVDVVRSVFLRFVAVLVTALTASGAFAQPLTPVMLAGATAPVELARAAQYWIDTSGRATVEGIVRGTVAVQWHDLPPNYSFSMHEEQPLWVRFETEPAASGQVWMIEVPYALLDRVALYTEISPGAWDVRIAGDRVPVSQRPVAHRHPLLPLFTSPAERSLHLVRIDNPHAFSAPIRLIRQDMLLARDAPQLLALGMYFGLLALGLAVASVLGLMRRDPALELFALKLLLLALVAASLTGVASLYLWPDAPAWNDASPVLFALGVFATTALIVATAFAGVPGIERLRMLMRIVAGLGGVLALATGWIVPSGRFLVLGTYALLVVLLGLLAANAAWRRGDRRAWWLGLSLLPLLIATLFPLARGMGLDMPGQAFPQVGLLVIMVEVPTMLLVLLRRSQMRLEQDERLDMLDRIDPTTGLVSMRIFLERGQQMIARCQRFGHQGAVLLIDIANADRIERDYREHRPGELPLRVAARLMGIARDIDVTARISGRRFGMVVEGPISPTEEAALGPRVVASCLMPFADKPEGWVAQVRVAYALVPLDGTEIELLEHRLSDLLASVPADSRKAVFTLGNIGAPTPGK